MAWKIGEEETESKPTTSIDGRTIDEWVSLGVREMMPEIVGAVRTSMRQEIAAQLSDTRDIPLVTSWVLASGQLALSDTSGEAYLFQWTPDQLLALADRIRAENREAG